MSSAASQARAQELNAKMEGEARKMLDGVERQWLRKVARSSYSCVVNCFDKAGTAGSSESLDQCSRNCQAKYQHANGIVQNETNQFQNRLNRSMMDCQDQARDMMKPGMENDPSKLARLEDQLLKCMSKVVDNHIKLLRPMKERIIGDLKKLS